jgi:hypothetical protein
MIEITIRSLGVRVSGDKPKELLQEAEFFQALPRLCPQCGAAVRLCHRHVTSKTAKTFGDEFDYYGLLCEGAPAHESTFGEHKKGGALFYRESEPWKVRKFGARDEDEEPEQQPMQGRGSPPPQPEQPAGVPGPVCSTCHVAITEALRDASMKAYGRPFCAGHMKAAYEAKERQSGK